MENIEKKTILKQLLSEYASYWNQASDSIRNIVIEDVEGKHFQLLQLGWEKEEYVFGVLIHFEIREGKIWVQENMTEELVAEELVKRGIPNTTIVLGVQPPTMRPFTAYASA